MTLNEKLWDTTKMGKLKPGATYVYERADSIIYARETGAAADTRIEVGRSYDVRTADGRPLVDHIRDSKMWGDIIRAAETNTGLRELLEQAKEFYLLSKPDQ
jgi:hypothetical protein